MKTIFIAAMLSLGVIASASAQYPFSNNQNNWSRPGDSYWNQQQRDNHYQQLEMRRQMEWQEMQRQQQEMQQRQQEMQRQMRQQRNCGNMIYC